MIPKSEGHKKALYFLGLTYWGLLLTFGVGFVVAEKVAAGFIAFSCIFTFICVPLSFWMSKLNAKEWYDDILLCGVRKIAYACSQMGRTNPKEPMWWEFLFNIYWCFLIKFINPAILYFILIGILKDDINKPYGKYSIGWQAVGWAIPIVGFMFFAGSFCICNSTEELDYTEFELDELKDNKSAT